ncbi:MAG TPA: aminoacetone oxidase family FAD-binding enzyme [Gemmatimonadales bacterium]
MNRPPPVLVIGAGAAGLVAAIFAARAGAAVVLLESSADGGRKILISGGGRCNILPSVDAPERFVTESSRASLRKILGAWPLADQRRFFERELGVPLVLEPESGKLFPAGNRAKDVRDGLVRWARNAGVQLRFGVQVRAVRPVADTGQWTVAMDHEAELLASAVVLATGGLSVPKTGSDGFGLRVARGLGHVVHEPYPALTPLRADPATHAHLSGISLEVTIGVVGKPRSRLRGGLLFTHRGYSGPSVLDISHSIAQPRARGADIPQLEVQWTSRDAEQWDAGLRTGRGNVRPFLARSMPARLAEQLVTESNVSLDTSLAQLGRGARRALVRRLSAYVLPVTGDEGYAKAEVTGGGVALSEVVPRTMESRRSAGLFLCGEMLDAFGPIGGYNFQWAWSTGRTAGLGVAARHAAAQDDPNDRR